MQIIKYSQYDSAVKRAVDKKLNTDGRSPSLATVCNSVPVIVENRLSENELVVVDGWRQQIKDFVNNYNFKETSNVFDKEK